MSDPEMNCRDGQVEISGLSQGTLLNRMTNRIRQSLELPEILSATVAEVRSLLSTDRVKIYRFHPDGSGEVIAESIYQQRLPSLLGLNFPADDIPLEAREMFVKARQRSIVDVTTQQISFTRLTSPETAEDLAVVEMLQRPVDPCHVEYLTAMGVKSSLVVPILHQQQLWGLLVSHHSEAKALSEADLQIIQMVTDQVSIAIAQSNLLSQAREQARREAIINQISTLLHAPLNIQEILQIVLKRVVQSVGSSGGRLFLLTTEPSHTGNLYTYGKQPLLDENGPLDLLEDYSFWQQLMANPSLALQSSSLNLDSSLPRLHGQLQGEAPLKSSPPLKLPEINREARPIVYQAIPSIRAIHDLYQESELATLHSTFAPTQIRSILIMPLSYGQQSLGCLTLFRDQVDTEKLWAGHWDADERQQRPRQSFGIWRELKNAQAQPWLRGEIELIQSLGTHLSMAVMQNRLYQCEREQRLLVEMRNQELYAARVVAEEASRLKSDFLSSTSHELRTPLASTLNYLKLLKEGFYDNEEELKEYIQVAYQSAENLVAIINDVLDIAKIEAGRMNMNLEIIHLPTLFQEEQNLFNLDSRRKGIALIVDCEVANIYADKVKLRQILTNLVSNALKFTSQGEIRIQATRKIDDFEPDSVAQVVEISIADTGIGIDISKRDLLFEPFVQADGSIKRRYGGTGLGLTICRRLVELMGGRIWIESPGKDQGTKVSFTLPDTDALDVQETL